MALRNEFGGRKRWQREAERKEKRLEEEMVDGRSEEEEEEKEKKTDDDRGNDEGKRKEIGSGPWSEERKRKQWERRVGTASDEEIGAPPVDALEPVGNVRNDLGLLAAMASFAV